MESALPWMVPVPVKQSEFRSFRLEHEQLNVETELGRVTAFSDCSPRDASNGDVMYADLQTNADVNVGRRLGSGRSGFYRGHYLKGIGRTQLAGNWNSEDFYHCSGLLFASGAVREYLVSVLLARCGRSEILQPCTGVLFRRLEGTMLAHQRNTFDETLDTYERQSGKRASMPAVDALIQAISVKPDNFARFSNIAWWLTNFPQFGGRDEQRSNVGTFFRIFFEQLNRGEPGEMREAVDLDAEGIANKLGDCFSKTIENFMEAWALGINWGSLHNNFTMTGRFLDLETPTVYPAPIWGSAFNAFTLRDGGPPSIILEDPHDFMVGFDVASIARQLLQFASLLRHRLLFLVENHLVGELEATFIRQFLRAFKKTMKTTPILGSFRALSEYVMKRMKETLELSAADASIVETWWACRARSAGFIPEKTPPRPAPLTLHKLEFPNLARMEPTVQPLAYVPGFVLERARANLRKESTAYNESLNDLEACTDVDELMKRLTRSEAAIIGASQSV